MIRPIYRKKFEFSILCDFDDLLALAQKLNYHICRSLYDYTDRQKYIPIPPAELAAMWQRLKTSPHSFESAKIWDASYLVAQPGHHHTKTELAAVITPQWFHLDRWSFHLGLNWRSRLPNAALELIKITFKENKQ